MNSQGSVQVLILVLAPLLMTSVAVLSGTALVLSIWSHSQRLCRDGLLETQNTWARTLESLVKMNPQAQKLRAQRLRAELLVRTTAGTPGAPAAVARLTQVTARQLLFRARQETLKKTAEARVRIQIRELKKRMQEQIALRVSGVRLKPYLDVEKRPALSLTPDHIPKSDLDRTQAIQLKWQLSLARLLPEWLKHYARTGVDVNQECSATLVQKGTKWIPHLGKGKSLSSSSWL